MGSIVPFVLEGIWAYKLTSLLEGDVDGRSGRDGRSDMKTDQDANWQELAYYLNPNSQAFAPPPPPNQPPVPAVTSGLK